MTDDDISPPLRPDPLAAGGAADERGDADRSTISAPPTPLDVTVGPALGDETARRGPEHAAVRRASRQAAAWRAQPMVRTGAERRPAVIRVSETPPKPRRRKESWRRIGGAALATAGVVGAAVATRAKLGGSRKRSRDEDLTVVSRAVTINRPRAELYAFWRDFSNLGRFMENIESITVLDATRSHWEVKAPAGRTVAWDAVVTRDEPGRLIAWESAPGADVRNAGTVEFKDAPGGRGTEVHADIAYDPPMGKLGQLVAKLFQKEPGVQARRDLRRFKQLMEAGEIATTEGPGAAPSARRADA